MSQQRRRSTKRTTKKTNPEPAVKRRRRRRSNPDVRPMLMAALYAAIGAAATRAISNKIPLNIGGRWGSILKTFAVAYGVGMLAEKAVSKDKAQSIAVGGAAVAVGEAIDLLLPRVTAAVTQLVPVETNPATGAAAGVGDIGQIAGGSYSPMWGYSTGLGDIVQGVNFAN